MSRTLYVTHNTVVHGNWDRVVINGDRDEEIITLAPGAHVKVVDMHGTCVVYGNNSDTRFVGDDRGRQIAYGGGGHDTFLNIETMADGAFRRLDSTADGGDTFYFSPRPHIEPMILDGSDVGHSRIVVSGNHAAGPADLHVYYPGDSIPPDGLSWGYVTGDLYEDGYLIGRIPCHQSAWQNYSPDNGTFLFA